MATLRLAKPILWALLFACPLSIARGQTATDEKLALQELDGIILDMKRENKRPWSPVVELDLLASFSRADHKIDFRLLKRFRRLRSLRLDGELTDAEMDDLVSQIQNVNTLHLGSCEITDAGLEKLATLENLASLKLSDCNNVTGDGLANLSRLTVLKVEDCHNITGDGFSKLEHLKELDISNCDQLRRLRIAPLKSLTTLRIHGCNSLTGADLSELQDLPNLTRFELTWCRKIVDSELQVVKALPHITHLNVTFEDEVADAGFTDITDLQNLKSLSLRGSIPDAGFADLGHVRKVTSLSLSSPIGTNDGIRVLRDLPELSWLRLGCKQITADGLQVLGELPRLTYLELIDCQELGDAEMAAICECKQLKTLDLSGVGRNTTAAGMAKLHELPGLESLGVQGQVSIEVLRPTKKLKNLKVLQFELYRDASIREFTDELSSTEIIWRKRTRFGPEPWQLETIMPRESQRLPHEYPTLFPRDAVGDLKEPP